MTEWSEFRPQQSLLHANFDGYRLSLEPLAQYTLKFDDPVLTQKDLDLDHQLYTVNGIKAFKSNNQLFVNAWRSDNDLYFFDQQHAIQYIGIAPNDSLSHLQQPICVYQLPSNSLYGSMAFVTETLAVVSDGRSKLFVLNTNSTKWKLVHEEDLDEFLTSPIRLLHAVHHEGSIHAIVGFVDNGCQLHWCTFSSGPDNTMKLTRRRVLNGKNWPDFVAIESNGQGLYIAAEGSYKFTFDSLIEVNHEHPPFSASREPSLTFTHRLHQKKQSSRQSSNRLSHLCTMSGIKHIPPLK